MRATSIARGLSRVPDADEHLAAPGQTHAGGELRLDECLGERFADAHHFAGRLHLRPEDRVDAGKLDERKHRFLDRKVRRHDFARYALARQRLPDHAARGDLGQRPAGRLRHVGHGARRARIDFEHVDDALAVAAVRKLDRELDVHQPDDFEPMRHRDRLPTQLVLQLRRQRERRQRARRVARVHAGLLDVLHDAADHDRLAAASSTSASTSTSIASFRKRSSSTGESFDTLTASRM